MSTIVVQLLAHHGNFCSCGEIPEFVRRKPEESVTDWAIRIGLVTESDNPVTTSKE